MSESNGDPVRGGNRGLAATTITVTPAFHDVDMMEIVWHGHYVKYFELARCALLDSIGYNYLQMKASGFAWPVVDMRLKYVRPARFNEPILVHVHVAEWENRLKLAYRIDDANTGAKLTEGYTIQVAVDVERQEMLYVSPDILARKLGVTG